MNTKTQGYESPRAMVVLFGSNEVTWTDSTDRTDGGHFGGDPFDIPMDPEE